MPGLIALGDVSIQGNIKAARSLTEPLRIARDNGAKKALVPIENKRQFLEVDSEIMEHVDPVFFGDVRTALPKLEIGQAMQTRQAAGTSVAK